MPLYEYQCPECATRFELLRGSAQADAPAPCQKCGSERPRRQLSLFASISHGAGTNAPAPVASAPT